MKPEEFLPYLTKFVSVHLDDGTVDSGYIANPADFRADDASDHMRVRLINGLLQTEIDISRIRMISLPQREDTTKIPILGFDESFSIGPDLERTEELSIEEQLDRLVDHKLFDLPELDDLIKPKK